MKAKRKTLPRKFRPGALAKADHRRREIRPMVIRLLQIQTDQGGAAEMPAVLQSVAERFVFVENRVQRAEVAALEGTGTFDLAEYLSSVAILAKLADRLGYQRKARRVSLQDTLAQFERPGETR